jgi:hypothetical protein
LIVRKLLVGTSLLMKLYTRPITKDAANTPSIRKLTKRARPTSQVIWINLHNKH